MTKRETRKDLSSGPLFRRLVKEHLLPQWPRILVALVLMSMAGAATAALAKLMEPVLDEIFVSKNADKLYTTGILIFVAFAVRGASTFGQSVLMNRIGQRIICDFQRIMFDRLVEADLAYYHHTSAGQLISRFTNDANGLRYSVANGITNLGRDAVTLIFLVSLLFYQDWKLAAISFIVFPLAWVPIVMVGRRMRRVSRKTQDAMASFTARLEQSFQGMRQIKAYNQQTAEKLHVHALVERIFNLVFRAGLVRASPRIFMDLLGGVTLTSIIFYGGWQVIQGTLTTGAFFSFITALLLAYEPMKKLANLNANIQEGLASAQRIFELMDLRPTITDQPDAKPLQVKKGEITFDNVVFSYSPDIPALRGISLSIPAGNSVALVGASGSGKSTLLNLVLRFFEVDSGAIRIDGQDIREVTQQSLRQAVGLVSQETSLFNETVRANIAFGDPNATEEQVMEAARAAAAHDFIMALPQGYDTMVGEHGVMLSGGQRQRIAIARAMLKNAPILLLDEATSSLDTESEAVVVGSLKQLMQGRTSLVVAHRLSTVQDADCIYVMQEGQIVESGRHADLLAKDGAYARLFAAQVAGEDG